jgi:hypothetical protein
MKICYQLQFLGCTDIWFSDRKCFTVGIHMRVRMLARCTYCPGFCVLVVFSYYYFRCEIKIYIARENNFKDKNIL